MFRFNLVTSPICVLCDNGQDMTAAHLDECSALNDLNCIVKRILLLNEKRGGNRPVVNVSKHDRRAVSSSPVPLNTSRIRVRFSLNISGTQMSTHWFGVVVRSRGAISGVVLVTRPWFKITRSVAKSPRAAEQCDVIIHSLTLNEKKKETSLTVVAYGV
ncbi:hypothetical protein TNCV_2668411 [Trichonephila clavipes]|nr:hypothetical protein TNCV_2668411 [Trichonephila clavipes]